MSKMISVCAKFLAWVFSIVYFFILCVPLAAFVYTLIIIIFFANDIIKFLKKPQNAKTKFKPELTERLP